MQKHGGGVRSSYASFSTLKMKALFGHQWWSVSPTENMPHPIFMGICCRARLQAASPAKETIMFPKTLNHLKDSCPVQTPLLPTFSQCVQRQNEKIVTEPCLQNNRGVRSVTGEVRSVTCTFWCFSWRGAEDKVLRDWKVRSMEWQNIIWYCGVWTVWTPKRPRGDLLRVSKHCWSGGGGGVGKSCHQLSEIKTCFGLIQKEWKADVPVLLLFSIDYFSFSFLVYWQKRKEKWLPVPYNEPWLNISFLGVRIDALLYKRRFPKN